MSSVFKVFTGESNKPKVDESLFQSTVATSTSTESAPKAPELAATHYSRPNTNILSADVEIVGSISFNDSLTIDGKVEGEITSKGILHVTKNADIKAEIQSVSVIIDGKVQGNIKATDNIIIKSCAIVIGDITAKSLSIESGATFIGKSTVGNIPSSIKPVPVTAIPAKMPTQQAATAQ